ncbi:hypothetical protein L1987_64381 [Smallanthus sonchifolius]|uniref:Uncharacterized protein n=1 Tax=Smallanthus sonchifolius TaxID=185202 RepID=A0ACB9CFU3_9ASTR|nr:hypothetical protein L1987_64381 [Smallanthus sonchifolius]
MDGPTTPSSHASVNPTNTMSSDANTAPQFPNRDMAWEWGECRDAMKKQCVWCKICGHKMSGGITRLKQHLTHTGGQVKGCMKVTVDIQKRVMESIKEKEKIQLQKKRNMQILSSHSSDEDDQDDVEEEVPGYYLNPAIFHGENSKEIKKNRDIVTGLYVAIDRLVPDDDENDKVRQDLNLYIDSVGQFGSPAAIRGRKKVAPCK